jgi:hypothetical protein
MENAGLDALQQVIWDAAMARDRQRRHANRADHRGKAPPEALADYYTVAGNPPGRWAGTGIEAMGVEGQVSEAQMKALFGERLHPDADARIQAALSGGVDRQAAVAAVRLGRRSPRSTSHTRYGGSDSPLPMPTSRRRRVGERTVAGSQL